MSQNGKSASHRARRTEDSADRSNRDFDAPKPCPYDASAAAIAARGTQMLYQLLRDSDPSAAEEYLAKGAKLMQDTIRECYTPKASLDQGGKVDFGQGGWETILQVRYDQC